MNYSAYGKKRKRNLKSEGAALRGWKGRMWLRSRGLLTPGLIRGLLTLPYLVTWTLLWLALWTLIGYSGCSSCFGTLFPVGLTLSTCFSCPNRSLSPIPTFPVGMTPSTFCSYLGRGISILVSLKVPDGWLSPSSPLLDVSQPPERLGCYTKWCFLFLWISLLSP